MPYRDRPKIIRLQSLRSLGAGRRLVPKFLHMYRQLLRRMRMLHLSEGI